MLPYNPELWYDLVRDRTPDGPHLRWTLYRSPPEVVALPVPTRGGRSTATPLKFAEKEELEF